MLTALCIMPGTFSKGWDGAVVLLMDLHFHCKGSLVSKRGTPFWTWVTPNPPLNPKVLCKTWIMYLLLVYILWRRKHTFLPVLELRWAFWFKAYSIYKFGVTAAFAHGVCMRLYYTWNVLTLILAEMSVAYHFKMGCNNTNSCNSFTFLHSNDVVHSENNKHSAFL